MKFDQMRFYHTTERNALILEWDAHLEILESQSTTCPPGTGGRSYDQGPLFRLETPDNGL